MSVIGEMLSYPFLVRALVGGVLVSLCAALLGVSRARACILLNQLAEQQIVVPLEEGNQRFYRLKR